jgi:hypothetical protein
VFQKNWTLFDFMERKSYESYRNEIQFVDFPKSAVRGSWKRRTFVTRKRAKFTGAFLLR